MVWGLGRDEGGFSPDAAAGRRRSMAWGGMRGAWEV